MKFDRGEKVLVEAIYAIGPDGYESIVYEKVAGKEKVAMTGWGAEYYVLHLHPGDWEIEHVADLVEELRLRDKAFDVWAKRNPLEFTRLACTYEYGRGLSLRCAREAASKPQFSEGQKVEIHSTGTIRSVTKCGVCIDPVDGGDTTWFPIDDISPVNDDD